MTRTDHELFYSGENAAGIVHSQSLTCPFCGKLGFTEATLVDHVSSTHTDSSHDSQEVICPICASTPGDDPNYFVNRSDFSTHINLEHRSTGQRDLISFLDEPSRSGAGVRRVGRGGSSNGTGKCYFLSESSLGFNSSETCGVVDLRSSDALLRKTEYVNN